MILVDANLLLYAVNADLPRHAAARAWLERTLSGAEAVGIPWVVLLAFVRIGTNPRVFPHPLAIEEATAYVDGWLAQPTVVTVAPGRNHWTILRGLLHQCGASANLTTDAHIAALAIEHGCEVYSTDNDFKRFPGITHVDPIAVGG
ncbi:MAG: type II toxin-antitoxin system VapC family toxin [Ectothiorhodospiraceae bacterium]|nr:type II toxin-antitoxin system VapC family toxin [Ectothiorhodospiraceae bacterium]